MRPGIVRCCRAALRWLEPVNQWPRRMWPQPASISAAAPSHTASRPLFPSATAHFETLTSRRSLPPPETSIICQSLRNFALSLLHQEPHNKVSKSFLQGRPTMKSFKSAGKVSKFRRVMECLRRRVNGKVSKSLVTSRSFWPYLLSVIPSSGAAYSSSFCSSL